MPKMRSRGSVVAAAVALGLVGSLGASAQSLPQIDQEGWAYLVRQDMSDCDNQNVNASDPSLIKGTVGLVKNQDGSMLAKVGITGTPNTRYNFYLKCVRQLGTIQTYDEGAGEGLFMIPPGTARNIITFDMYPDGAPGGNKFQSTQATFNPPLAPGARSE
jgi:hypothetical protein